MHIFKNKLSTFILNKNYIKLHIPKTRKNILIGYTKMLKDLKFLVSCKYQLIIINKYMGNKKKKDIDLLIEYLLPTPRKHF